MSTASHAGLPAGPLAAIGALVVAVVLAVALVQATGIGKLRTPDSPPVEVRALHFEDRADGSIAVLDANSGATVHTVAPGTQGFLRGTLRGVARERKRAGMGPALPFELIGRADGRLMLHDPATGRRVDLGAFGPTNAAVFAQLMHGRAVTTDPAAHADTRRPATAPPDLAVPRPQELR